MATHSGMLAWRTPWTEESGGLHSPRDCKELDMTGQLTLSPFVFTSVESTLSRGVNRAPVTLPSSQQGPGSSL